MKIGVISDTHIPDSAKDIPAKILEDFKNVDMVIHAGDLVDLAVLDELKSACRDVRAVSGNMDPRDTKGKLSQKLLIEIGKYRIGVMHGYGHPDYSIKVIEKSFENDIVNIIIFGHSHKASSEHKGNILYFNPGSPTDKIYSPYNSYGIIEITDKIEATIIKL